MMSNDLLLFTFPVFYSLILTLLDNLVFLRTNFQEMKNYPDNLRKTAQIMETN